jgi:hypothetical protein
MLIMLYIYILLYIYIISHITYFYFSWLNHLNHVNHVKTLRMFDAYVFLNDAMTSHQELFEQLPANERQGLLSSLQAIGVAVVAVVPHRCHRGWPMVPGMVVPQ